MNEFEKPPLNELVHFGVKGMKWGERKQKEPSSVKLARREKKALKFDRKAESSMSPKQREIYLREAQRARDGKLSRAQRQVIVGAAFVAAYATYKFIDSGEAKQRTEQGKAFVDKVFNSPSKTGPIQLPSRTTPWSYRPDLAHKDLSVDQIEKHIISRINPGYGKPGTTNNCRRCTFAYEMSRRGFDVAATKSVSATGQNGAGLYNTLKDSKKKIRSNSISIIRSIDRDENFNEYLTKRLSRSVKIPDVGDVAKSMTIFDSLKNMPNGSRGELEAKWSIGGGHSMAWEIVKGSPVIFDTQTGRTYNTPVAMADVAKHVGEIVTTRLDNVELDTDFLRRWLKDA